jgi:hypothetical protein
MKKLIILLFLITSFGFSQTNTKGRIHFTFEGEKYDLPISQVTLRKENNMYLSLVAEHNDSLSTQRIAIEIGFTQLSMDSISISKGVKIEINTRDNIEMTGHDLFLYMNDGMEFEKNKGDITHYAYFTKGERVSWELTSVGMGFTKCGLTYDGKELKVCGGFNIDFRTTLNGVKDKVVAQLKDCFFDIVL